MSRRIAGTRGATLAEYALLLVAILIVGALGLKLLGAPVKTNADDARAWLEGDGPQRTSHSGPGVGSGGIGGGHGGAGGGSLGPSSFANGTTNDGTTSASADGTNGAGASGGGRLSESSGASGSSFGVGNGESAFGNSSMTTPTSLASNAGSGGNDPSNAAAFGRAGENATSDANGAGAGTANQAVSAQNGASASGSENTWASVIAESARNVAEGAICGDFCAGGTWSHTAGSVLFGMTPFGIIADGRDLVAAGRKVWRGEDGAWVEFGQATVGFVPGIGDAIKGGRKVVDNSHSNEIQKQLERGFGGGGSNTDEIQRTLEAGIGSGIALGTVKKVDEKKVADNDSVRSAMDEFKKNAPKSRARDPMSLNEYFGKTTRSSNEHSLTIELIKPDPKFGTEPIPFLHAKFHNGDRTWNDRYKDVQLYELVESTNPKHNPFPAAAHVPNHGASIVRIWPDYQPVKKGAPSDLSDVQVRGEVARISVWSYVGGNLDGPAHNMNNGGFAKVVDAEGNVATKGVLIDSGAAWNAPPPSQQPWNTNILGKGPVKADDIPPDVVDSLRQIATSSRTELAQRSRFDHIDDGAKSVVGDIRIRSRQVLDHYGYGYNGHSRD